MLALGRIALKHHRFEVALATIVLIVIGIIGLVVALRLRSLAVSSDCFRAFVDGTADTSCQTAFLAFDAVNQGEATPVLVAMLVAPLAAGLLLGVSLVGKEIEARTATTAWWIAPSRRVWFVGQLAPIVIVVGAALVFAAVATSLLAGARTIGAPHAFADEGMHGALAVVRGAFALALGLVLGAATGRTLLAFIVGAAIVAALFLSLPHVRQAWIAAQPRVAFDSDVMFDPTFGGSLSEQAWRSPNGRVMTEFEASEVALAAGGTDTYQWLTEHGYEVVQLGITPEVAANWGPTQGAALLAVATLIIAGTVAIVDRRRPR